MDSKLLILVTNYYPYFRGEEYLETEIDFLCKRYTRILIIPTMVNQNMKMTRFTPENVDILDIKVDLDIRNKIRFLFSKTNNNPMLKKNATSIGKLMYQKYFENRANYVFNLINKQLNEIIIDYTQIDIYSYWLYITARVSIQIKEYLLSNGSPVNRIVSRAHRYDLYENESLLNYLPEREYLLSNLDEVFVCSKDGSDHLKSYHPGYDNKISISYLGVDSGNFSPERKSGNNIIVSCSGIRKVKRLNLLIAGLQELERKNISYKWYHFGNGKDYEKITKLAKRKLKQENFEFMGSVSNQSLKEWYDNSNVDIFINVSSSEGAPVSIMEAMARGIPIIATDVGGTREMIDGNGILLPKNISPKAISCAIEKVLNSDNYEQISIKSYEIWNLVFNSNKNYKYFSKSIGCSNID